MIATKSLSDIDEIMQNDVRTLTELHQNSAIEEVAG